MTIKRNEHPSIENFKQFVSEHPLLIEEINNGRQSLQTVYEQWSIYGEADKRWHTFKENNNEEQAEIEQTEDQNIVEQIVLFLRQFKIDDIQNHLGQLSLILESVQEMIQTFQQPAQDEKQESDYPFSFRQD